jgi:hypothetical protein
MAPEAHQNPIEQIVMAMAQSILGSLKRKIGTRTRVTKYQIIDD